ncbi:hypothetical protein AAG895_10350 [Thauera sp. JM12B12]|uniref:hypothetical protein n=1 Tax=Thauera sp. JM12B12 TaxID=3142262 RepID=UPI0031F3D43E
MYRLRISVSAEQRIGELDPGMGVAIAKRAIGDRLGVAEDRARQNGEPGKLIVQGGRHVWSATLKSALALVGSIAVR